MATIKERMEMLGGVGLFSGLTKRELQRVVGTMREVAHPAGRTIVRQGASAHAFHLIVDGEATVSINGRRRRRLGPGDFFGELAIIDGGTRSATITSDTPIDELVIDGATFRGLLKADGKLALRVAAHLVSMVRETNKGYLD